MLTGGMEEAEGTSNPGGIGLAPPLDATGGPGGRLRRSGECPGAPEPPA